MKTAYIFDVYDDYNIRLRYIRDVLAEKGYQVTIFLSDFDHFHKEKYRTKREDVTYIDVLPYQRNFSWARIHSHMKFADSCLNIQKEKPADLCYVMVPPNSLAKKFGRHHKKNPAYKLIFDVCDMWPESFPAKGLKGLLAIPFSVWAAMRDSSLKYADGIMTECDLFKDLLSRHTPKEKMKTFWLCRKQLIAEVKPVSSDILTFAYLGSINNVVDVDAIVSLLGEMKKRAPVHFHIIGDGEQRERMIQLLSENGISYEYHGLVFDEDEKKKIFESCHYGFNMMRDTACIGLTMKSLDYLAYDLPLINNVPADTASIVEKHHLGINVTDFAETAEKILAVSEEDYMQMRGNIIAFYRENLSDTVFKQSLAAWI